MISYKNKWVCSLVLLMSSNTASALDCFGFGAGFCLDDGVSQFEIDSYGIIRMTTNNVEFLRTGDFAIAELSYDPDIPPPFTLSGLDYLDVNQRPTTYTNTQLTLSDMPISTWGKLTLDFQLLPGVENLSNSSLIETFTLTNISDTTVDLGLFAYSDHDMAGPIRSFSDFIEVFDVAENGSATAFRQFDASSQVITSVNVTPDYYESGINNECLFDLCEKVFFDVNPILSNVIESGPADLEHAFQWVRTLAAGESFTFTQTRVYSAILANQTPVANAGEDQSYSFRQSITLDGQSSYDPDGQIVAYQWNQISGAHIRLKNADQAVVSFRAPKIKRKQTGSLVFELTVTDDQGASATDTVIVNIAK